MRILILLLASLPAFAQGVLPPLPVNGPALDYWASTFDVQGDTPYCVQLPTTFASGGTPATMTLNRGDGTGNHTITAQLCTTNDTNVKGTQGNIVAYTIGTLDLSGYSVSMSLVNAMSSYGGPVTTDVPAGWFGKYTSADVANVNHGTWKSSEPFAVAGGYVCISPNRQNDYGGLFEGHDNTLVCSPDGGAHWCNPYTYFNRSGGAGCDATNWSATGDAPKCDAASGTATCTNTAYLDGTHSSMMWKEPSPYNGSTGIMQQLHVFDFCQGNDCTLPFGPYLYAITSNGNRATAYLVCVSNSIGSVLDPAQYWYYVNSNYTPASALSISGNCGAGANWTQTQASATPLWVKQPSTGNGSIPFANFGVTWRAPVWLCDGQSKCTFVMTSQLWDNAYATNSYGGQMWVETSPAPWGPWTPLHSIAAGQGHDFVNIMRETCAAQGNDSMHFKCLDLFDAYYWYSSNNYTIASITAATNPILTLSATMPGYWTGTTALNISGATGCWAAINGTAAAGTAIIGNQYQIQLNGGTHDTSACTGGIGSPLFQAYHAETKAVAFYQPVELVVPAPAQGSANLGNSGIRFSTGSVSNAIPRKGLEYYFDFYEHRGNTSWPFVGTIDQARVINSGASGCTTAATCIFNAQPTAVLWPCYAGSYTGCGFKQNSTMWASTGISLPTGSQGLTLYDLTPNGAVIKPALFASDLPWSFSGVVQWPSASTQYRWFGAGNTGGSSGLWFWTDSNASTTNPGSVCAIWNTALNVNRGVCSAGSLITGATWAHVVMTRGTGVIAGSVKIYINGVESSTYYNFTYGGGGGTTPVMTSAQMWIGSDGGAYQEPQMLIASVGIWNRVLNASEVKHLYTVMKSSMALRGIALP